MTGRTDTPEDSIELRLQAEMISREKEAKSLEVTRQVVHKLQVHQLELEMKNIGLRLAQTKHEAMRERYFDLYEHAPVGYCAVCAKGLILESNNTAASILGVDKWEIFKQPFRQYILIEDQDIFFLTQKQLFEGAKENTRTVGSRRSCEVRMVKKDGTIFWAWLEASVSDYSPAGWEQIMDEQSFCRIVMIDITDRKGREHVLRDLLEEKRDLLREVHYQIKSNLANIMVLFDLRIRKVGANQKDAVFLEQNSMLRSLLLAHEHLYQSKDFCRINFQDYIEDVISHICLTYERTQDIRIAVAAKDVELDLDSLLPCGLLVTELVTNALKYAFPEQLFCSGGDDCKITVNAQWDGLAVTLVVADNGVGLPTGLDWTKTKTTGFLLVRMLGEHRLHGRIMVDCTTGTSFRLRFVPRILL